MSLFHTGQAMQCFLCVDDKEDAWEGVCTACHSQSREVIVYLSALSHVKDTHLLQDFAARYIIHLETVCYGISLYDGAVGSKYACCAASTWCCSQLQCSIPHWGSAYYERYYHGFDGNLCRLATILEDEIREAAWLR